MGVETWFRGEGVGVAPATPGGSRHDLKDGVYFADTERVAAVYASERAPTVADRRVYKVSIDTGSMKVLDLTTHPGWQKLMQFKLPNGDTPEVMLRRQPSAEEYEKWFNSFLTTNKVDLKQYDAVIGPEFRNGGKQLCILHKNGQPSPLVARLRALFVPVGGPAVPASPRGSMRFGGKIGTGLRGVAGSVGGTIALLGLSYLMSLLEERNRKKRLDAELQRISPEIDTAIKKKTNEVAELLSNNHRAFANITVIRIERTINTGVGQYSANVSELPKLQFDTVTIDDKELKAPETEIKEDRKFNFDNVVEHYRITFPVEVTMSQQEVDLYAAFVKELRWYEAALAEATAREDVLRLSNDKTALEAKFRAALSN